MTFDGKILKGIFEHERLKPALLLEQIKEMPKNLAGLRQVYEY